ncbi:alpha/beta hydrolase family esterase, partial [Kibdelosporangium lantanae]
ENDTGELTKVAMRIRFDATGGTELTIGEPSDEPVEPLDGYRQKVLNASSRNTVYPYELTSLLGDFVEHDLDAEHRLVPVDRPKGQNKAAIVAGVITTPTELHPEGVTRVILLGDPTKSLGSLTEAECRRVIGALDLASEMRVPVEWYSLSAGAKISMDSGSENLDWVAAALKRIVEFTQAGGEINIVVAGINVGAQPYWNAEATMLMHTKGILVMTPDSAMVLTGKQALDFSGGVSAEDNFGIGGYDRDYWLHLPATYQPNQAVPVVMAFHGRKGNGLDIEAFSGLDALNAIVVYPVGLKGEADQPAWQGAPYQPPSDDVLFVSDLLDTLQNAYCVDPRRIYATGKSNGGGFTALLACRLQNRIAAFAT